MELELVNNDDCKRQYPEKFAIYKLGIVNIIPWLKEQIESKGTIFIKNKDIAKEMDKDNPSFIYFQKRCDTTIFRALRYILKEHGILVSQGDTKKCEKVLIMRDVKPEDVTCLLNSSP